MIQIPFDPPSESRSCQGPALRSSLGSESRNEAGVAGARREPRVSSGDRCCRRPLPGARLPGPGHLGAFTRGLPRRSLISGSTWDPSLCGPPVPSVSPAAEWQWLSLNVLPNFQSTVRLLVSLTMAASDLYCAYVSLVFTKRITFYRNHFFCFIKSMNNLFNFPIT